MSYRHSPSPPGGARPVSLPSLPGKRERQARGLLAQRDYMLAHAGRQVRIGPIAFWLAVSIVLVMALWSAGTATYFAFRDDLLTRLIGRQAEMQYAYEDRITELRAQIDRLTSRQLLDQEQVEHKIGEIMRRQTTLESRTSAIAGLPDLAATGSIRTPVRPTMPRPDTAGAPALKPSPINDTVILVAPPDREAALESRVSVGRSARFSGSKKPVGLEATLTRLAESLDRVEARQGATLIVLEESYEAKLKRMRGVLSELGLDLGKMAAGRPAPIGGPFIPVAARSDGGFERQLARLHLARQNLERLTRTAQAVPLRKPIIGEIETTSGFGVRMDPFVRAMAMHSGLDFRGATGDPVRATAAGKVVSAGWSGGYGRMVEIDHGNGFSTRYGHLSEILVSEDQAIKPGQIIGRVGSTGRSTGPHLHYETRIDGEAVDPQKFLRAGLRLGEKS
jgi:murein DD-endopeptidase MepM/ murein hydrolase activator NlpD